MPRAARPLILGLAFAMCWALWGGGVQALGQEPAPPWAPLPPEVKVTIVEPATGAVVTSPVRLVFRLTGARLHPAGPPQPGTGHFHLLIDAPLVPAGQAIPSDAQHLHFGRGQSEATIALAPGTHTLTLLLADGLHRSYGSALSDTITLRVTP